MKCTLSGYVISLTMWSPCKREILTTTPFVLWPKQTLKRILVFTSWSVVYPNVWSPWLCDLPANVKSWSQRPSSYGQSRSWTFYDFLNIRRSLAISAFIVARGSGEKKHFCQEASPTWLLLPFKQHTDLTGDTCPVITIHSALRRMAKAGAKKFQLWPVGRSKRSRARAIHRAPRSERDGPPTRLHELKKW